MRWRVTIPGQPVSVNHQYQNVYRKDKRGRTYKGRALTPEAKKYFEDAVLVVQAARPSRWKPAGQVRVIYDLFLQRSIDSDNLKIVGDAIAVATGIDDSRFLVCTRSKQVGLSPSQARIEVTIEDELSRLVLLDLPPSQSGPTRSGISPAIFLGGPRSSSEGG